MIEFTKKIMSGGAIATQPKAPGSAKRSARQAEFARQRTKRVIDIVGALVFFAMFGGIFLAVWLGVLLTTGRPAIYRHQRIGYRGKPFYCLKFRSMTPDSDAVLEKFLADNEAAREEWRLTFKLRNDPRVTRFGCLLRKTSLDELPQFWNVLRGDMSLVGPRPVVRKELDCFYGADAAKMYESVKPGLTGPWQVGGRSDTSYEERVAFDCDYVRNCSTWGDIKLIARTASSVLTGKGFILNAAMVGTVLQKSRAGMLFLFARQLVVQGANIVGLALIARALGPQEYGLFVSLNMLVIFGISLLGPSFANALVIAEKPPTLRQYGVVYTAQMAIAIAACGVFGLCWSVGAFDALDAKVVSAAALVVASFLLMPRAAAGQASLERELDFKFVAASDIAQCLTFNIVAVALCHAGWGIGGCAIAFAARFVVANLLLRHRREVKIASLREFRANSRLVKSGFYLQSATLVSAIKDSLNPIVVGLAVGSASVGLLSWAGMVAAYPSLLLFLLARIYLPLFSRLRGDPAQLRDVVSAIVFWTNVFVACLSIPTLIYIDEITAFFFGAQWSDGIAYFYGFWFANLFVATVTPILALMNALHKQRWVLGITVVWMACTWLLGVPLSICFGAWGFVAANVITQLTNIWVVRHARSLVPFDLRSVGVVWLVSALAALPFVALQLQFSMAGWQLIGVLVASVALLLFVNFLTFHDRFVRAKNLVIGRIR